MIGRSPSLFPSRTLIRACGRNQLRSFSFTRQCYSHPSSTNKLRLSLASLLGIVVAAGCSWYRLNLDASSSSTRDDVRQQPVYDDDDSTGSVRTMHVQTSEKTVFPGDHTGVARFDMAHSHSTSNRVSQFTTSVLPVPSGYWSILALLSAEEDPRRSVNHDHEALSWMRRNIAPAVAGALADVHRPPHPPLDAQIDNALRQALTQLDRDARTGAPWTTRDARPASTLLAFYDSDSRILRIANTGASAGRAFLGRRVGNHDYECRELSAISVSDVARQPNLEPVVVQSSRARTTNIDEAFVFPSRGLRDVAAGPVEVQSVEVQDGDFLVLGSDSTWVGLAGDEAVQAVSMWMREQEEEGNVMPVRERSLLDVPWQKGHDLVSDLVRTMMVPRMIWDINEMFVGFRGNAASRVLRQMELGEYRGKKGSDHSSEQDQSVLGRSTTSCLADGGSVMVVVFADGQPRNAK